MHPETLRILIRGGGDLASGVALRLHHAGWRVLITEVAQPLAVRRLVSFADAVYSGETNVEDARARRVNSAEETFAILNARQIPVLVDVEASSRIWFEPHVLVDARMIKMPPELPHPAAPLSIGLGPGFTAGVDCHAVVETKRGPYLGRIYWQGSAEPDSGLPERVAEFAAERVLRAPVDGVFEERMPIGSHVDAGTVIAQVGDWELRAPFGGVIRGLVHDGIFVKKNMKIGDVDPRDDLRLSRLVSDKSLSVGGAVLEAILSARVNGILG